MSTETNGIILVMFASYKTLLIEKFIEGKISNRLLHFPKIIFQQ